MKIQFQSFQSTGKRFFSVVFAVVMLVCMAVPAFADLPPVSPPYTVKDGVDTFGIFTTTTLTGDVLKHMQDIFVNEVPNSIILSRHVSSAAEQFYFIILPVGTTAKVTQSSSTFEMNFYRNGVKNPNGVKYVQYTYQPSSGTWKPNHVLQELSLGYNEKLNFEFIFGFTYEFVIDSVDFPKLSYDYFWGAGKRFSLFVDDGGLMSPTDPDPDPDPPIVIPPVEPPVTPDGNPDFVPYDTSVWDSFFKWVSSSIGNAVNIGLMALAIIMGIYIVIAIVKKFTK